MQTSLLTKTSERVAKYADMFSAMGTEPRLRIMQLLLSAHPEGLVVGDIQGELEIPNSTLSHPLEKLKTEGLVEVRREGTFLRYTANTEALQELLRFLYAECCTRNKALKPEQIVRICKYAGMSSRGEMHRSSILFSPYVTTRPTRFARYGQASR
jgi:DNA-binding transcriptional ArsR family regulator